MYKFLFNGPLLSWSWVDKRAIYFLSTMHMAETSAPCTVKRRQADGSVENLNCLPCLQDHQSYMRGLNRNYQLGSYYNVGRQSHKWWKRGFSCGLECCLGNAFVYDNCV